MGRLIDADEQEAFVCCSLCGYPVNYDGRGNENFCPNCGAKMDLEEKDG